MRVKLDPVNISLYFFSLKIYFRERVSLVGGAEGEGEKESRADSALNVEADTGLDPTTPRSRWSQNKSRMPH